MKFFNGKVAALLTSSLVVRIAASFLPSFDVDMGAWLAWAGRLSIVGADDFYTNEVWTQYTPGFLYWLLLLGKASLASPFVIKLPAILADMGTALLAYKIVRKKSEKWAIIALSAYLFNPATIFISSVWGQIDGILAFLMLLAVHLSLSSRPIASAFAWTLSFLTKPQSIALVPALEFIFARKYSIKTIASSALVALLAIIALSLPFFLKDPILGLPRLILSMGNFYNYTSLFAFNIWSIITPMWSSDAGLFPIGALLFIAANLAVYLVFRKAKTDWEYYLVSALSLFSFFLFPTRVHERYLFPALVFVLVAAGLKKSIKLIYVYAALSLLYLVNTYHAYAFFSDNFLKSEVLLEATGQISMFIAVSFVVLFFALLFYKKKFRFSAGDVIADQIKPTVAKKILLLILAFSFVTRIFGLGTPGEKYFDEVYHAFTAQVALEGDPKAWQWWNSNPEGFAYEWTHPPLSKVVMAGSMTVFGKNPVAWRLPAAIAGTGVVYLTYALARRIFDSEDVALLSAGALSLDGLVLVMSRIGMNDIYFLVFAMASLLAFLKKRDFAASVFFGLSVASKWSGLWLLPILALAFVLYRRRFSLSLLWFALAPPLIYLAAYIPMFLTGNSLGTFFGVQEQMWLYHTRLDATHPYTSPWWSWPILKKPIWLYTSGQVGGKVGNVYAMGNPVVFWFGLVSVGTSVYYFAKTRDRRIFLIIFSYIAFFIPWAVSPRIMFLYHYLPSLPFMAIATGFVLKKNKVLIAPFFAIALAAFVYFYPHWTGIKVPVWLDETYYWFSTWR